MRLAAAGAAGASRVLRQYGGSVATAWVWTEDVGDLAPVCVKTGAPTTVRLQFPAVYHPVWTRSLLPWGLAVLHVQFNVLAFVLARLTRRRSRIMVALPVSERAFRRHRTWLLASAAGIAAGVVVLAAAAFAVSPWVALAGAILEVAGFSLGAVGELSTWVGLSLGSDGRTVTISRCHRDFARSAGHLAGSRGRAWSAAGPGSLLLSRR